MDEIHKAIAFLKEKVKAIIWSPERDGSVLGGRNSAGDVVEKPYGVRLSMVTRRAKMKSKSPEKRFDFFSHGFVPKRAIIYFNMGYIMRVLRKRQTCSRSVCKGCHRKRRMARKPSDKLANKLLEENKRRLPNKSWEMTAWRKCLACLQLW